jgi:hypothetical protein
LHCNENCAFTLAVDPVCLWNPAKMEVVVVISVINSSSYKIVIQQELPCDAIGFTIKRT